MKKLLLIILLIYCNSYAQFEVLTSDVNGPIGLAKSGEFLYIAEASENKISKFDLNDPSSPPIDLVAGLIRPNYLVINNNFLYYSEYFGNRIAKVDITQTNPVPEIVKSGLENPQNLLLEGNELYYTEYNLGRISKIDISINNPEPIIITSDLITPLGIAIYENELYYAEYTENSISKVDLGDPGSNPIDVITGLAGPAGGLKFIGSELYFFELIGERLSKVDVSVANPQSIFVDIVLNGADILIDSTNIYISDFENDLVAVNSNILNIEGFTQDRINLYPNPSRDIINIDGISDDSSYIIYDTLGRVIKEGFVSKKESVDVSILKPGHYYFVLSSNKVLNFIKI